METPCDTPVIRPKDTPFLYALVLGIVGLAIFGVLRYGADLAAPVGTAAVAPVKAVSAADTTAMGSMMSALHENLDSPLGHLFLQLLVIIVAARIVGKLFVALGQPSVVGEMAAGILLGPSLFGLLTPDAFHFVFPATSLAR